MITGRLRFKNAYRKKDQKKNTNNKKNGNTDENKNGGIQKKTKKTLIKE